MHPINDLLEISLSSLQRMIEANTIIGNPLEYNNCIIIPISSLKMGFISGGSDINDKNNNIEPLFGGGTGGGVSINPVGFLVINNSDISFISIDNDKNIIGKIINSCDDTLLRITNLFKNNAPKEEI